MLCSAHINPFFFNYYNIIFVFLDLNKYNLLQIISTCFHIIHLTFYWSFIAFIAKVICVFMA